RTSFSNAARSPFFARSTRSVSVESLSVISAKGLNMPCHLHHPRSLGQTVSSGELLPRLAFPSYPGRRARVGEKLNRLSHALAKRGRTLCSLCLPVDRRPKRVRHGPGRGQAPDRDQKEVRSKGRPHLAVFLRLGQRREFPVESRGTL